jgi:hypothetical protein
LVDLIEKERKGQLEKLLELKRDKLKDIRRKVVAGIVGGVAGLAGYEFMDHQGLPFKAITSSVLGFLFYESFSQSFTIYKSPLHTLAPKEIYKNFRGIGRLLKGKLAWGTELEIRQDREDIIAKSGVAEREINEAFLEVARNPEKGRGQFFNVFDLSCRRRKSQNLLEKLIWNFYERKTKEGIARGEKTSVTESLLDVCFCMRVGRTGFAKYLLDSAIETSEDYEERQDLLCMKGYVLEFQGEHEEARKVFGQVLDPLVRNGPQQFTRIDGTKNEVYVLDSKLLGGAFVCKTQKDKKLVELEEKRTSFFREAGGERFVKSLGIIVGDGVHYNATRRVGRFGLNDYLLERHYEEARDILDESLEAVLLLHLRSKDRLDEAGKLFGEEDFRKTLWRKFVEREKLKGNVLLGVERGLSTLVEKLESVWRTVAHGDYHPGNVRVDENGNICIIDAEDGIITTPYVDPVGMVGSHLFGEILNDEDSFRVLRNYNDNAVESGAPVSIEESMWQTHLAGVFKHLTQFGSVAKFTEPEEFEVVRAHHIQKGLAHIRALEGFGTSGIDDLRTLKTYLEDIYCNA